MFHSLLYTHSRLLIALGIDDLTANIALALTVFLTGTSSIVKIKMFALFDVLFYASTLHGISF